MMRMFTAAKRRLFNRRKPDNKWTDYDAFMRIHFPYVIENRDKYYH